MVALQDKVQVRGFAASKGVRTARLLHVTDRAETLPLAALPPRCMLKANHSCAWNIMRFDGAYYFFGNGSGTVDADGAFLSAESARACALTEAEVLERCRGWLASRHFNAHEWAYQQIPPRILVEEWLEPLRGAELLDYRFFTFNGDVKAIAMGSPRYRKLHQNVFFDPDWNAIALTKYKELRPDPMPDRPAHLDEMLRIARTLGEGIDFIRVDLYETTQGVVLGEMTVYPEAGEPTSPTTCPVFNHWLSDHWKLRRMDAIKALLHARKQMD
ncbi:MAG: hypothetical protein KIS92_04895 [Planctomycetota bacterium]|nr:hypothetical protein [Planctomycetota bacterium]